MSQPPARSHRRGLHPAAWWLWATCLAGAAIKTTNPLLLLLIGGVAGFVVSARRTSAPWARSWGSFVRLGAFVIVLRVVIAMLFGVRLPGHRMFSVPSIGLPSWAAGVSVGGPVTVENVLQAVYDGLRLAIILVCFGAANSLASPYRLLRCLPAVLYEAAVAVTVALAFAPEAVMAAGAIREARRLRGRPTRGVAGLRGLAVPVLESALDRSLQLAASMDARGYGRRAGLPVGVRRVATAAGFAGLLVVAVGSYGILDAGSPGYLGFPTLGVGMGLLTGGLIARGRRSTRTRYRPDPWRTAEWSVASAGALTLLAFVLAGALGETGLAPSVYPLAMPALPLLPLAGIIAAIGPAFVAPAPAPRRAAPGLASEVPRRAPSGRATG